MGICYIGLCNVQRLERTNLRAREARWKEGCHPAIQARNSDGRSSGRSHSDGGKVTDCGHIKEVESGALGG